MQKGISGFTIIKNAEKLGYPLYYSVKSIIDVCDEFVISEGNSEDRTMDIIHRLQDEYPNKIKVFHDEWHKAKKGETIATITNNAIDKCSYEWAYCIQADEIIHEDNLNFIKSVPHKYGCYHSVSFEFTHFRPTLEYEMTGAYTRAIRMFRNYSHSYRKKFRISWQKTSIGAYLKRKLPVDPLFPLEDIYSDTDGFTFAGNVAPVLRPTTLQPISHVGYVSSNKEVIKAKLESHAQNLYPDIDMYSKMANSLDALKKPQESGKVWEEQGYKIIEYRNKAYPRLLTEWAREEGVEYIGGYRS
jgi:hypothetical protein